MKELQHSLHFLSDISLEIFVAHEQEGVAFRNINHPIKIPHPLSDACFDIFLPVKMVHEECLIVALRVLHSKLTC